MMIAAKMPKFLAIAEPTIGWIGTTTMGASKILPGMPGARFKQAWSVGASTDWAINKEGLKESNGILNINIIRSLGRSGILVEGVPGEGRGEGIMNEKMFMPYVKMPRNSEGGRH